MVGWHLIIGFCLVVSLIMVLVDEEGTNRFKTPSESGNTTRSRVEVDFRGVMGVSYTPVSALDDLVVVCHTGMMMCQALLTPAVAYESSCMLVFELLEGSGGSELHYEHQNECGEWDGVRRYPGSLLRVPECILVDEWTGGIVMEIVALQWRVMERYGMTDPGKVGVLCAVGTHDEMRARVAGYLEVEGLLERDVIVDLVGRVVP